MHVALPYIALILGLVTSTKHYSYIYSITNCIPQHNCTLSSQLVIYVYIVCILYR